MNTSAYFDTNSNGGVCQYEHEIKSKEKKSDIDNKRFKRNKP